MRFFLLFFLFIANVYSDERGNEISLNYEPKGGVGEFLVSLKNCDYILEEDVYKIQAAAHCESHKIPLVGFYSSPFRNSGCEISYVFQCETKMYIKERQKVKEKEYALQRDTWAEDIRKIENEITQRKYEEGRNDPKRFSSAKRKCIELGYKSGTEKFGTCVLELTK